MTREGSDAPLEDPELASLAPPRASAGLDRALRVAAPALGIAGLLQLLVTVAGRVGSPFPLEWMEGAIVHHGLRLFQLQPLYGPPAAEFTPYLYPPLGYLPIALAAGPTGGSLPAARLACLACTVATLVAIARLGGRASGSRAGGLLGAGLFALGFGYTGGFMDLARIDMPFIALMSWGGERLAAGRTRSALWLLAASALCKQHGLVLFSVVGVIVVARGGRRAVAPVAAPALALVAALLALQWASEGWFGRYVFELPASHGLIAPLLASFLLVDLVLLLPVLTAGAALWLRRDAHARGPLGALLLAAVLVSALGRAHAGGHDNVRLPAFALLCALGLAPVARSLLDRAASRRLRLGMLGCVLLQCALLWQPATAHWPAPSHGAGMVQLQRALSRCADGGRAVALDHALLTGVPFVHTMAISDLRMGTSARAVALADAATGALLDALTTPDAPAAIAIGASFPELEARLERHYRPCAQLSAAPMPSGYQPRSQRIFAHARVHSAR